MMTTTPQSTNTPPSPHLLYRAEKLGLWGVIKKLEHARRRSLVAYSYPLRGIRCKTNFNPIDITIVVRKCSFLDAVEFLDSIDTSLSEQ